MGVLSDSSAREGDQPQAFFKTLSQALVALTVEIDNEWEHRFWRHVEAKPLRTSLVMWANFLRFVGEDGVSVRALSRKAGYAQKKAHPDSAGMIRWRYVTAEPGAGKRPSKLDQILRPTAVGAQAAAAWEPLPGEIEARWVERYGAQAIGDLRDALLGILEATERPLTQYYSVLDHKKGMWALDPVAPECDPVGTLALPFLLSQVSQRFTLDFERDATVSMALQANLVRVLGAEPVAKRDLPLRSGISKEALAMGINHLKKQGLVAEGPAKSGRGKAVSLTEAGLALQAQFEGAVRRVEQAWEATYSVGRVEALRAALSPFEEGKGRLFEGLDPYAEGWRAKVKTPEVLPHHPMVLYRGGWPDGS